jgi:histidinol dehydrogenase
MLKILNWQNLPASDKKQHLARVAPAGNVKAATLEIISEVRERGDAALLELTKKFDGVALNSLIVSPEELQAAATTKETEEALRLAIQTITQYHEAVLPQAVQVKTAKGVVIDRVYRPIQRVGLYVPGGRQTPLISSVLMQAIPARIAGCPVRVLCTPPNNEGELDPNLLVAARLCGIETIYKMGGAQAIAAMAYGTETIPKVDKIFGPGNAYVTEAKTLVSLDFEGAAIDMPAGPSEVMVLADDQANPSFVAADLLAQAEHGPDSQVICICDSSVFAQKVLEAVIEQTKNLSRNAIIQKSLAYGSIIICPDRTEQLSIINTYAPEHLIINREEAQKWVEEIHSAGTIFLGPYAPETLGDYVTGSNHVLPTNGYARQYQGLSTVDFLKAISVQFINDEGIKALGPAAFLLANLEGLDAHANAVQVRLSTLGEMV